ncbi:hypothetical protein [Longimicrobium sp.]|uniref:hypothetical protein n=1 Tax=Longimicrobium sp. TaxID=2029185 RepID=UPI002E34264E|nr:hypothetical protein [Longimicrobium sp.]HEX6037576.1 hypothetical protein [Longimicrobium sp.]
MTPGRLNVLRAFLLLGLTGIALLVAYRFGTAAVGVAAGFSVIMFLAAAFLFAEKPRNPEDLKLFAFHKLHDLASDARFLAASVAVLWIVAAAWTAVEGRRAWQARNHTPGLAVEVGPTVPVQALMRGEQGPTSIEVGSPGLEPPRDADKQAGGMVGGYLISDYYPTFTPHRETVNPQLRTAYSANRWGDTTFLRYKLPYLDHLLAGEPIEGIKVGYDGYFSWIYPEVSVRVVNNSTHVAQLAEAVVTVHRSEINYEPVPVIDGMGLSLTGSTGDMSNIGFTILNNGWGPMLDPELRFAVVTDDPAAAFLSAFTSPPPLPHSIRFPTIHSDSIAHVPLEEAVPGENPARRSTYISPALFAAAERAAETGEDPLWVAVIGRMSYRTTTGERRNVPFRTALEVHPEGFGDGFDENSYPYSICLPAGVTGEYRIPTSQTISAGGSDRFTIQIGSDKSARYEISLAFRATGGEMIQAKHLVVDVFVPANMSREEDHRCTVDAPVVPPAR